MGVSQMARTDRAAESDVQASKVFTAGVELRRRARKSRLFLGPRPLFGSLRVIHVSNVV